MLSHYLKQCWNIVNWTLWNKFQWNYNWNATIFIEENDCENVVWKMLAILSRLQCVKFLWVSCLQELTRLNTEAALMCVSSRVDELLKAGDATQWLEEVSPTVIKLKSCAEVMCKRAEASLTMLSLEVSECSGMLGALVIQDVPPKFNLNSNRMKSYSSLTSNSVA